VTTSPGIPTPRPSARSKVALTSAHLKRLGQIADADYDHFTRPEGRPEYAGRRVLVVLAQGAAQHYVDCLTSAKRPNGIKDLDVWSFYAAIPGTKFPAHKRKRVEDFGASDLGRIRYDYKGADTQARLARWKRWEGYQGRVVDLMVRPLPVDPGGRYGEAVSALRDWLHAGTKQAPEQRQSNGWLALRPVVVILPSRCRGKVVWPGTSTK
jgi:hypothetical protein